MFANLMTGNPLLDFLLYLIKTMAVLLFLALLRSPWQSKNGSDNHLLEDFDACGGANYNQSCDQRCVEQEITWKIINLALKHFFKNQPHFLPQWCMGTVDNYRETHL